MYKCQICNKEAIIIDDIIIKQCKCECGLIADMEGTVKGVGKVD